MRPSPEVTFPQVTFPQVTFPQVTFPDVTTGSVPRSTGSTLAPTGTTTHRVTGSTVTAGTVGPTPEFVAPGAPGAANGETTTTVDQVTDLLSRRRDGTGIPLLVVPRKASTPAAKAAAAAAAAAIETTTTIREFNAPPTTAALSPVGAFPPDHMNFFQRTPLWLPIAVLLLLVFGIIVFFSGSAPTAPIPVDEN